MLLLGSFVPAMAAPIFVSGVSLSSGWLDVNKTYVDDSNLCWAASSSNLLAYTGWTGGASLDTTAEIFADFKTHWTNQGGHPYVGTYWWFTGTNMMAGQTGWAQLEGTAQAGLYDAATFDDNYFYDSFKGDSAATVFSELLQLIDQDYGLALSIEKYVNDVRYGHSITLWGIDTATGSIYITDSDDGVTALKSYHYSGLSLTDYFGGGWSLTDVTGLELAVSAVPEPASLLLFGVGGIVMGLVRRKGIVGS
ncbi:MAG: hypothetical protein BWK76_27580 [Desulfobulbaceae bacterium A2]|nr:MAG: hypothetical protein BWK76_27580 [Desulfobulbaceae bacterium A2]